MKCLILFLFVLCACDLNSLSPEQQAIERRKKDEASAQFRLKLMKLNAEAKLIEAKAEAEANRLINDSVTPKLTRYELAKKWDGKLPSSVSGAVSPFVEIKSK